MHVAVGAYLRVGVVVSSLVFVLGKIPGDCFFNGIPTPIVFGSVLVSLAILKRNINTDIDTDIDTDWKN